MPKQFFGFLVAIATTAVLLVVIVHQTYSYGDWIIAYDYRIHFDAVRQLSETGKILYPHMLFHALGAGLGSLLAGNYKLSAMIVLALAIYSTAFMLHRFWFSKSALPNWFAATIVPVLLIVSPITIFYWADKHLYFGYIGINTYHSPTILLQKPFSLMLFYLSGALWSGDCARNYRWLWWALPIVTILSALAKPSLLIVFLPGLLVFLVVLQWRKNKVDWPLFLWGILLPALLVLSWQYWFTYADSGQEQLFDKRGIAFAPLQVVGKTSQWLFWKFLLSTTFPLATLILFWRSIKVDRQVIFAWMIFFFGTFVTYFLMESGPRAGDGNFLWSGQISLFLLFVASAAHIFNNANISWRSGLKNPQFFLCAAVLLMHFLSGCFFLIKEFKAPGWSW